MPKTETTPDRQTQMISFGLAILGALLAIVGWWRFAS
jgi:hypothetical protein